MGKIKQIYEKHYRETWLKIQRERQAELEQREAKLDIERAFFKAKQKQREIEERYNHNHDSKGRFASKNSSTGIDSDDKNVYNDNKGHHIPITTESISSVAKPDIFSDDELNVRVQNMCKDLLNESSDDPPFTERAYSVTLKELQGNAKNISKAKGGDGEGTVIIPSLDEPYISIHNHPSGETFSGKDVREFLLNRNMKAFIVIGNNGEMVTMVKGADSDTANALPKVFAFISGSSEYKSETELWKGLSVYGIEYKEYARSENN